MQSDRIEQVDIALDLLKRREAMVGSESSNCYNNVFLVAGFERYQKKFRQLSTYSSCWI